MNDVVMKKSKLEMEKENSKKRLFSELTKSENEPLNDENQTKRRRFNADCEKDINAGFMSDVVVRKSKLE